MDSDSNRQPGKAAAFEEQWNRQDMDISDTPRSTPLDNGGGARLALSLLDYSDSRRPNLTGSSGSLHIAHGHGKARVWSLRSAFS